jgi:hypothetical protein
MPPVARFERDVELRPLRRHVEEQPVMRNLEDIAAESA